MSRGTGSPRGPVAGRGRDMPALPGGFLGANLAIAFLLELCALAALGYWGVRTGSSPVTKTALGIGAPLLAAVLWGLFAAPRARIRVPALRMAVKVLVFGGAVVGLYAAGHPILASVLLAVVILNAALIKALTANRTS